MPTEAIKIYGLRELESSLRKVDAESAKGLRREIREAGKIVSVEARRRSDWGNYTRMGIRPRVRNLVAMVEQSRGKTTGKHPSFGALQMSHSLVPALDAKADEVIRHVDDMLDRARRSAGF